MIRPFSSELSVLSPEPARGCPRSSAIRSDRTIWSGHRRWKVPFQSGVDMYVDREICVPRVDLPLK